MEGKVQEMRTECPVIEEQKPCAVHYMDIVDRIQYEIGMVEFIRNNSDDKDLEGACALLSESMVRTQKMLVQIGKAMNGSPDLQ